MTDSRLDNTSWLAQLKENSARENSLQQNSSQKNPLKENLSREKLKEEFLGKSMDLGKDVDEQFPYYLFRQGKIHELFFNFETAPFSYPPFTLIHSIINFIRDHPTVSTDLSVSTKSFPFEHLSSGSLIFWVGEQIPSPYLTECFHIKGTRNYYINASQKKEFLWIIETLLRSAVTLAVIAFCPTILSTLAQTQRLSLAALRGNSIGFLIRNMKEKSSLSAAFTRWEIKPTPTESLFPTWETSLLKCKGPLPRKSLWNVECEYGEKISLCVLPELVNRYSEKKVIGIST